MHAIDVKTLLEQHMLDSEILVEGEGCDFQVTVISDQFQGILPVKRQQMVYRHLNDFIRRGEIHAVTMKTHTRHEWQQATRG
ncbi:MAG: BolA/IbaG family iron-sulfur metabolism protein [Endozoicomonas sp. (ex Botrylloides leachii)]|nr:BolA/IbaG family iron-sulfur metabolism protein [Endozoicomonas sp. (ex Botrylloides leachii)]